MKRYIKPKITAQKIKMSFFLTNVNFLDSMNLVGDIYAQSANTDSGGSTADANNSTVDNGGVDTTSPTSTGTTSTSTSNTNSVGPGDCIAASIEANGGCAMCYGVGNCADPSSNGIGTVS